MTPPLHRPSVAERLTLHELESEARRLNREHVVIVTDDRLDVVMALGLTRWAEILEGRIVAASSRTRRSA